MVIQQEADFKWQGIFMFLAGFLIWNIDNVFCHHITQTKQKVLLPWAIIFEGHGWWHILTGLGMFLLRPSCFHDRINMSILTLCVGGA